MLDTSKNNNKSTVKIDGTYINIEMPNFELQTNKKNGKIDIVFCVKTENGQYFELITVSTIEIAMQIVKAISDSDIELIQIN